MQQSHDTFTITLGDAIVQLPARAVVQTFLKSILDQPVPPATAHNVVAPAIGAYWAEQGGIYAGLMRGANGSPDYFLIVASDAEGFVEEIKWGAQGEDEAGAACEWDGLANTIALRNSKHSHPAAEWTATIEIDGQRDFYLASRRESALAYANVPELFKKCWYWTSTQYSPDGAWTQHFGGGNQNYVDEPNEFAVRAVRRLFI